MELFFDVGRFLGIYIDALGFPFLISFSKMCCSVLPYFFSLYLQFFSFSIEENMRWINTSKSTLFHISGEKQNYALPSISSLSFSYRCNSFVVNEGVNSVKAWWQKKKKVMAKM